MARGGFENYTDVITVAVPAPTTTSALERAAAASAATHRGRGPVVTAPLSALTGSTPLDAPAVVVPEAGEVECFPGTGHDLAYLRAPLRGLFATGWTVTVIVGAARMGEAHRALRGVPVAIQPWWEDPDGVVRFGGPEVP